VEKIAGVVLFRVNYDRSPFRKYSVQMLQASAMVSRQANWGFAQALILVADCAQATDETVEQVAAMVLAPRSASTSSRSGYAVGDRYRRSRTPQCRRTGATCGRGYGRAIWDTGLAL
jgi:hypothetical protein